MGEDPIRARDPDNLWAISSRSLLLRPVQLPAVEVESQPALVGVERSCAHRSISVLATVVFRHRSFLQDHGPGCLPWGFLGEKKALQESVFSPGLW